MRIDKVYIKKFKNLIEFNIDLNENEMKTVLLGQNATGKSNFIEALVLIFKYLDLQKDPPAIPELSYKIDYFCHGKKIQVEYLDGKYIFKECLQIDEDWHDKTTKSLSKAEFFRNKDQYLPKYVFTYYSGVSNRLQDHFNDHQKKFYDKIKSKNFKDNEIDSLRRLFYVQSVHAHFVLMAYFYKPDKESNEFLNQVLGIEDLESILFVLRKPRWNNESGDKRFFGSEGLVKDFLVKLWGLSVAPIYNDERVNVDFRSETTQHRLYLFIKDTKNLVELADFYGSNTGFFKALESTYISDLVEEVRVKVKKKFVKGNVTFRELSEGEQQLLTVLGLLKFTKDEESLILLDEPDTHLNPIWKWKYLEFLDQVVKNENNTQIIINTHDPLVIGGLTKEQVRIFRTNPDGGIISEEPDVDPKGLGVAGILTSEIFGLPTTLDKETQEKLNRKRFLQGKLSREGLDEKEVDDYSELKEYLEKLGFYDQTNDELYNLFLEEVSKNPLFQKVEFTPAERNQLESESQSIIEKILKEKREKDV